jgi:tetratricopeptide (TPR) repeat protein
LLSKRADAPRGQHHVMPVNQAGQLREQIRDHRMRLADATADLGTAFGQRGEYAQAERLLRQAITIYESCSGPDHARLAAPLSALSALCAARGRLGEADRLCRRALTILNTQILEKS